MNCSQIQKLLQAHHDGELDAAHEMQVEEHFADCPQCFAVARKLSTLRGALRHESLRFTTPDALRQSVRATIGGAAEGEREPSARRPWSRRRAWAAAAVLLTAAVFSFQRASRSDDPLLAELTASHVRSLMVAHLTDVASTDQHTVKPWFEGKLDFAPPVKDLHDSGFPLVGGRLDYVAERPAAALVYARQKHFINLFVWPMNPPGSDTTPRAEERNGYHLIHWSRGGMIFWAISDLNEKELMDFARIHSGT
jgi:anti-sigma factor RsiW